MKKFAAIFTSMLLAMSMTVSSVASSATADQTKIDFDKPTTLTLTKTDDPDAGLEDENPVKDAIFTAYKVLDLAEGGSDYGTYVIADEDLKSVVVREDGTTLADDLKQQTGSDASVGGLYTSTDELESAIPQIVKLVNDGKLEAAEVAPATDAAGKTTFTTLDLGVYLVFETVVPNGFVVSSDPFLVTLPQWDNDNGWQYAVDAYPKDQPMTIDKKANGLDDNNYEIGQKVEFTVNADIPNYGYTNESVNTNDVTKFVKVTEAATDETFNKLIYNFSDTATDGITFLTDGTDLKDLKVEIVDVNPKTGEETVVATLAQAASKTTWKQRANGAFTGTGDYVVNAAANTFTLDVAWAAIDEYQMLDTYQVKLTYYAQINEKAIDNSDINEVSLTYDRDPNNNPPIPDYDTIYDESELYSYELNLTKKFDGQAATDASAVTFQLYRGKNNTDAKNIVKFVANGAGNYIVWNEEMEGNPTTVTDINCAADGALIIDGLDAYNYEDPNGFDGYYTLLEVKTKDGYAVPATPFTIQVKANKDADGKLIPGIENATNFVYDGTDAKENNLELASKSIETAEVKKEVYTQEVVYGETNATTTFKMAVNNVKKQFNLPLTGGLGLWMFTIGGGVVMAGVIIFFSAIRKKESK